MAPNLERLFFSICNSNTEVWCSTDPLKCPLRKTVGGSAFTIMHLCRHGDVPKPKLVTDMKLRQCMTPKIDLEKIEDLNK